LLARLLNQDQDEYITYTYDYPVNPSGIRMVAAHLEKLAKSLSTAGV
jgi:hypothetical protein